MACGKSFAGDVAGALFPSLQNVVHAMERPFFGPEDEKGALDFLVEVLFVMVQVDGCGRAVVFAESANRGRVAEAAQIFVIGGLIDPFGKAFAGSFAAKTEQHVS